MTRSVLVKVVAAVVLSVFSVGTWTTSGKLDVTWLQWFSAAVLVATLVLTGWDLYLWRLPMAQRLPGVPRNVRGTWKGEVTSLWKDPTGSAPDPVEGYLVVRQTFTTANVRLHTLESTSKSTLAQVSTPDGSTVLDYLYLNIPRTSVQHRSVVHHGSVSLEVAGSPAHRLTGRYWTDRDSKGELRFTERSSRLADDFDDSKALF